MPCVPPRPPVTSFAWLRRPIGRATIVRDEPELSRPEIRLLRRSLDSSPAFWRVEEAGRGASSRRFLRISCSTSEDSRVLVRWDARDPEWAPYVGLMHQMAHHTRLLPSVLGEDRRRGLIVVEDLGPQTLGAVVGELLGQSSRLEVLLMEVVDAIVEWEGLAPELGSHAACRHLDREELQGEIDRFTQYYVTEHARQAPLLDPAWSRDCAGLIAEVLGLPTGLLHRDLHSENIVMSKRGVRFADHGGTCQGPPEYDLASLLLDPVLDLDPGCRDRLHRHFRSHRSHGSPDADDRALLIAGAVRMMNVLAAYAFFVQHRQEIKYRPMMAIALDHFIRIAGQLPEYPSLTRLASACAARESTDDPKRAS